MKAPAPHDGDNFGAQVALSADASLLVVGAPLEDSNATGIDGDVNNRNAPDTGAVFVFHTTGCGWALEAYLKPPTVVPGGQFGTALALSQDGNTLVASAPTGAGAAYVFHRVQSVWMYASTLVASNAGAGDQFGNTLAIAGNGATIFAGAPGEQSAATGTDGNQADNSLISAGAAYSFERTGNTWSQTHYVKPNAIAARDTFGFGMALANDGTEVVIGAPGEDTTGTNSGALTVFTLATTWTQRAFIDTGGGGGALVGVVVAMDGAGMSLAAGSSPPAFNDNVVTYTGGETIWIADPVLASPSFEAGDLFGRALAMSNDGSTLIVGSPGEDSPALGLDGDPLAPGAAESGAAFVFQRTQGWSPKHYVKATNTGAGDAFGTSVAVSANGDVWAVGATQEASGSTLDPSDDSAVGAGAVYVYR